MEHGSRIQKTHAIRRVNQHIAKATTNELHQSGVKISMACNYKSLCKRTSPLKRLPCACRDGGKNTGGGPYRGENVGARMCGGGFHNGDERIKI